MQEPTTDTELGSEGLEAEELTPEETGAEELTPEETGAEELTPEELEAEEPLEEPGAEEPTPEELEAEEPLEEPEAEEPTPEEPGAEEPGAEPGQLPAEQAEAIEEQADTQPEEQVDVVESAEPVVEVSTTELDLSTPSGETKSLPEGEAPPERGETVVLEEAEVPPAGPPFGQRIKMAVAPLLERLSATTAPLRERLGATLAPLRERMGGREWLYGAAALAVLLAIVVILFVPPFALLEHLGIIGFETLSAQNSISHPDGITLSVAEDYEGSLRVRLEAVSRDTFLLGDAGLGDAAAALLLDDYKHLTAKSPFYRIRVIGEVKQPITIDVVMPNDAEPWETLDLYTWTGEGWEWVGGELHTETQESEFLRAQVTSIPVNVVVMQAGAVPQVVSAPFAPGDDAAIAAGAVDEVNPTGLVLGPDGVLMAQNVLQPAAEGMAYATLPTISTPDTRGPLSDILSLPDIQEKHITTLVQMCLQYKYAGIDLDYRGVLPEERAAYSAFVGALADALHAEGLRLTVAVEPPTATADGWDTGGYDWPAIAAAADAIKLPFPDDPAAYVDGGEAQRLLDYATAQVPRYKLRMTVPSLSVAQGGEQTTYVSLEEALAPFGKVVAVDGVTRVEPNAEITFDLSGTVQSIKRYDETGTYRLEYTTDAGVTRNVWLGTAANLAAKLQWAQRYHLGGVDIVGLLSPGNAPGTADVVRAYRAATAPPADQDVVVTWIVTSAAATVDQQTAPLTNPGYTWIVMAAEDTYTIQATIAGFDHGSLEVTVASALPPTPIPTPDSGGVLASAECLQASFVADVTIPDNTKLDKGEEFVKTWRLQNSGTCDWPEETILAKVSSKLEGPESVSVGAVAVGATVDVSVDLKAPDSDGSFDALWELRVGSAPIPGGRVVVVIQAGEGGAPAAPPVAGGVRGSFELGGHVRDMAMPYADKMKYAGMTWAKVQVRYPADTAGIIAAAHAKGFKIQVSALGSANMVTQAGFEQQYANWAAGIASAGADAIEVWNEPNIEAEWALGYIGPQAYTKLLCAAYSAIKGANPNTIVISAATAPTGYFGGCGPNGCDDLPFLQGMYNAGAAQCMDYLGAHHNAGATSPSARSGHPADDGNHHHSWYFLPQTELYYQTFGGSRQLFYTEMGYASQEGVPTFSDWFGWARGINNAQQAAWLAEAVQLSVNTGMVRCIIVWNIDFGRYGQDPQDGYAIIRPGGSCPACDSLHNVLGSR